MNSNLISNSGNFQDLLKMIALITMIVDHTGVFFYPSEVYLRVIGRLAMPLFCFFAGYNFKNYPSLKIFIGAIFLVIFNPLIFGINSFINILLTIFFGQCYLYLFKNQLKNFNCAFLHVILLEIIWSWSLIFEKYLFVSDYGSTGIAVMVMGYYAKANLRDLELAFKISLILTFIYTCQTLWLESHFFKLIHLIILTVLLVFLYLIFKLYKLNEPISINFKLFTRHTLSVYIAHLMIYQMIVFRHLNFYIETLYNKIALIY